MICKFLVGDYAAHFQNLNRNTIKRHRRRLLHCGRKFLDQQQNDGFALAHTHGMAHRIR